MIEDQFHQRLSKTKSLPSPPAVAVELLALADDPDVAISDVVGIIERDPALSARLLRVARSPIHMRRRPPETVREAAMALGLNTVFAAALSFSLLPARDDSDGVCSHHFWDRSVLTSAAARIVATRVGATVEDAALAGLLADIGVLAIHRVAPEVHAGYTASYGHHGLLDLERGHLGGDHAEVGAWLLRSWSLPEHIASSVDQSHAGYDDDRPDHPLAQTIALSSLIVDVMLDGTVCADRLAEFACGTIGLTDADLDILLGEIGPLVPEMTGLFDAEVPDVLSVLEEAREALVERQARVENETARLRATTEDLANRTRQLEDQSRRDPLTGLANRRHLSAELNGAWEQTRRANTAISAVFIDLDHFKSVNDTYGHLAGDNVLAETARRMGAVLQGSSLLARYGGEEFIIVLPGADEAAAARVAEAVLDVVRSTPFDVGTSTPLSMTTSAGVATVRPDVDSTIGPSDLLTAADGALYEAKNGGRDRWVAAAELTPAVAHAS